MRRVSALAEVAPGSICAAKLAPMCRALLLLAEWGNARAQKAQPSTVSDAAPATKPSKEPERVGEFADSVAEGALASDPEAIYRKEGQRRVVELGRGWSAWLDRTQASQLNNPTSTVAAAGGRESRVGFDFKGQALFQSKMIGKTHGYCGFDF